MKQKYQIANKPMALEVVDKFRKPNETIAIRPHPGNQMTFLTRKIFNSLLYEAQQQGLEREEYSISLSKLTRNANYNSNDTKLLLEHLLKMMQTSVIWNSKTMEEDRDQVTHEKRKTTLSPLLADVEIEWGGQRSGLETKIKWSYTKRVRGFLLNADEGYTSSSLKYQMILKTHAALVLFEHCQRYASNDKGKNLTNRESVEWWYSVLTGNAKPPEDKYFYGIFKRNTILPAINIVNAMTHLTIEFIEHKEGKKVVALQFRVPPTKLHVEVVVPSVIDTELLKKITDFGLTKDEAEKLVAQYPDTPIRSTVDLVVARVNDTKLGMVDSPAAFFKAAFRNNYAAAQEKVKVSSVSSKQLSDTQKNDPVAVMAAAEESGRKMKIEESCNEARKVFASYPDEQRKLLQSEFESEHPGTLARAMQKYGATKGHVVETKFMTWLADRILVEIEQGEPA